MVPPEKASEPEDALIKLLGAIGLIEVVAVGSKTNE
jgi:hypothetical protein